MSLSRSKGPNVSPQMAAVLWLLGDPSKPLPADTSTHTLNRMRDRGWLSYIGLPPKRPRIDRPALDGWRLTAMGVAIRGQVFPGVRPRHPHLLPTPLLRLFFNEHRCARLRLCEIARIIWPCNRMKTPALRYLTVPVVNDLLKAGYIGRLDQGVEPLYYWKPACAD